ncbi:MAG: site-specific DNA-methyltransferase [Nitrosomonas sp.]|uniref:DNA-methyltransferase n=1 Tax=Nitrosomonas sp. TaxID=42353 RepID=UPI0032ED615D
MKLIHGDCAKELKKIPDRCVDMVMCDPPYGVTDCEWDTIVPFEPMWEELRRIVKPNGAIVLFTCQPFTTKLINSNMKMFRYCWIWKKNRATGFLSANERPLNNYEELAVFSQQRIRYRPQGVIHSIKKIKKSKTTEIYTNRKTEFYTSGTNYPKRVLEFDCVQNNVHPCQKPVELLEYLIRTYTEENDVVLDFCMGSGSTGVASLNLNRQFIGIELNTEYFEIARNRICMV